MNCRWNGQVLCYPTAFSILPKHWNFKAYEVKNVIAVPERDKINNPRRKAGKGKLALE